MKTYAIRLAWVVSLALLFVACDNDEEEIEPVSTTGIVNVQVQARINGENVELGKQYPDAQNRQHWYTTLQLYLSQFRLNAEGAQPLTIEDVQFFDFDELRNGGPITSFSVVVPAGNYSSLTFDCGVPQNLNERDPSVYPSDHPLSISRGMYWTWSTQYIFAKMEGYVMDPAQTDPVAWFIHTGTENLYRSNVTVERPISVAAGGTETVTVILNLDELLVNPHSIDLATNGQSHTTDNLDLAQQWMDNLAEAFE